MKKKVTQKAKNNFKKSVNIINFQKSDSFFFRLIELRKVSKGIDNFDSIKPSEKETIVLRNEIEDIKISYENKNNGKEKKIEIIPAFLEKLNELKEVDRSK